MCVHIDYLTSACNSSLEHEEASYISSPFLMWYRKFTYLSRLGIRIRTQISWFWGSSSDPGLHCLLKQNRKYPLTSREHVWWRYPCCPLFRLHELHIQHIRVVFGSKFLFNYKYEMRSIPEKKHHVGSRADLVTRLAFGDWHPTIVTQDSLIGASPGLFEASGWSHVWGRGKQGLEGQRAPQRGEMRLGPVWAWGALVRWHCQSPASQVWKGVGLG